MRSFGLVSLIVAAVLLIGCGSGSGGSGGSVGHPQFATVASFTNGESNPYPPEGPLTQGADGNFYGVTSYGGGSSEDGTLFELTSADSLTTLHSFCETNCADGANPNPGLILATDGNLYGTTSAFGGAAGVGGGTFFSVNPAGVLTTLYSFCALANCLDGSWPDGSIQAADGNFYGTTLLGGTSTNAQCHGEGCGTFFSITPQGTLTTLYSFCMQTNCSDGDNPNGLIQAADGSFYGNTIRGGTNGAGTVFRITSAGTLTTLYTFCAQTNCTDGEWPTGLLPGSDGNFYGTTQFGGAVSGCAPVGFVGCGTVFKLTPSGTLTTLYNFCSQTNCADGYSPSAGLIQGSDGNFYGVTPVGGDPKCTSDLVDGTPTYSSCGTVFRITPAGALTTLHTFENSDGNGPNGALLQAANGILYGTTVGGGPGSGGTIFSLSVGLGP